jgi:hypothetical protein
VASVLFIHSFGNVSTTEKDQIQHKEWRLLMEALSSSETTVLTRATRRNIPEDAILHSHRHENLKSYIALTGWTL